MKTKRWIEIGKSKGRPIPICYAQIEDITVHALSDDGLEWEIERVLASLKKLRGERET